MASSKSSYMKLNSFPVGRDNTANHNFLIEQLAKGGLVSIESRNGVRLNRIGNTVVVETYRQNTRSVIRQLDNAWRVADFSRSCELSSLVDKSDYRLFFSVSFIQSAALESKRTKLLIDEQVLSFMIDGKGNVCVFGKGKSVGRVLELFRAALDDEHSIVCEGMRSPYKMTLHVPKEYIQIFVGTRGGWLEEKLRCLINIRFPEANTHIPVNIITSDIKSIAPLNEALIELAAHCNISDLFWLHTMEVRCAFSTTRLVPNGLILPVNELEEVRYGGLCVSFGAPLKKTVTALRTNAEQVRQLESSTNCTIKMETTKRGKGYCVVQIVGENVAGLSEALTSVENMIEGSWVKVAVDEQPSRVTQLTAQLLHNNTPLKSRVRNKADKMQSAGRTKPIKLLRLKPGFERCS